jgi:hypothetical protein
MESYVFNQCMYWCICGYFNSWINSQVQSTVFELSIHATTGSSLLECGGSINIHGWFRVDLWILNPSLNAPRTRPNEILVLEISKYYLRKFTTKLYLFILLTPHKVAQLCEYLPILQNNFWVSIFLTPSWIYFVILLIWIIWIIYSH